MIKVGLAQFNVDFASEYLPYSVALLQAYALHDEVIRSHFEFLPFPMYKRERDTSAVARRLAEADIVAFSVYVWNTRYSLDVAGKIKALNPEAVIIFGGPNVPDRAEDFLRSNPCVDFTIYAEGEAAFSELLRARLSGDYSGCSSLRFLDKKTGAYRANKRAVRISDLSEIPSPYLSGVFDRLMAAHPDQTWNVIWETNRGCPFSCTYCDWGSAVEAKVNRFPMERLTRELEWFSKNRIEYLMCADANFGMMERDVDIARKMAALKKDAGYPAVLAATFTKNATERSYKIAEILMGEDLIRGYTVSTQSVDELTLKNIRRDNISQETFTTLQARFNRDRLPTYTDLIIGLPGETFQSFKRGVSAVVARGQFNKCYFLILSVLPNSQMAAPEYREKHGLDTVWGPQKNMHEAVGAEGSDITEYQELIIGTKTMPREDWRKTLCYGYMVSLIYFNKLLHIPLTVLLKTSGIDLEAFVSLFLFEADRPEFPLLSGINRIFREHAESIQRGGMEYLASDAWLKVWWSPDKIAFMEACKNIDQFYEEAGRLLAQALADRSDAGLLETAQDGLVLNQALVRSPFKPRPDAVVTRSNIYDFYRGILEQNEISLEAASCRYFVHKSEERWENTDDWCKKVVWFGNKTSAYLSSASRDLATDAPPAPPFSEARVKPYLYT